MALTELILQKPKLASIGVIELDASVRELHSATAKATRHPIEAEDGWVSDITDHVHIDPLTISIEGVISGTPAENILIIADRFAGGALDPVKDAHQEWLNNLLTGALVTVVTTLLEYPDMVLEKVDVTREASKGNDLYFSATAVHIRRVTLETIDTGGGVSSGAQTKSGGRTPAQEASSTQTTSAQSALSKVFF